MTDFETIREAVEDALNNSRPNAAKLRAALAALARVEGKAIRAFGCVFHEESAVNVRTINETKDECDEYYARHGEHGRTIPVLVIPAEDPTPDE